MLFGSAKKADPKIFKKSLKKVLTNSNTCGKLIMLSERVTKVGVDCGEGPPVPIPNTEVKLTCAENTWREAAREDK